MSLKLPDIGYFEICQWFGKKRFDGLPIFLTARCRWTIVCLEETQKKSMTRQWAAMGMLENRREIDRNILRFSHATSFAQKVFYLSFNYINSLEGWVLGISIRRNIFIPRQLRSIEKMPYLGSSELFVVILRFFFCSSYLLQLNWRNTT